MKTTATVNEKGVIIGTLAKRYLSIIESGTIQKSELLSLCGFFNCTKGKSTEDERRLINSTIADLPNGLKLSDEQNKQGIDYLRDQWKTPKGTERKNNPFGYREHKALDNFSHFTLRELYNAGNYVRDYYMPLYELHSNDGSGFEYHMSGGKVNIVG